MTHAEGNTGISLGTEELFTQGFAQMRALKNRAVTRRGRDKAMELVTELFLTVNEISRRVGGMSFGEAPVMVEDEDDAEEGRMPMAALFPVESDEDDSHENVAEVHELRELVKSLRKTRADYYRDFLSWHTSGCRNERDVVKKLVAIVRRVKPELLNQFGRTQADVARKTGETRAAVSAREKRVYEKPLLDAGARGVLGNGARSATTSARCAKAAKGNKNRRKSKRQTGAGIPASASISKRNQRTA